MADLGEGYYNVICDHGPTQALMAFKTGDGCLYKWHVLPQGAKNSPGIFQAAMEKLLQDLLDAGTVRVYLDDLLRTRRTRKDRDRLWQRDHRCIRLSTQRQGSDNGIRFLV